MSKDIGWHNYTTQYLFGTLIGLEYGLTRNNPLSKAQAAEIRDELGRRAKGGDELAEKALTYRPGDEKK